ncbi:hypothetical protein ACFO5K_04000 [Nocardia halotolerans]|uniref:Immunity repressor n=1 Tax=Nocardia halotolerans TaxID=1755878 RepID=A0ABV8VDG2_9NOCA
MTDTTEIPTPESRWWDYVESLGARVGASTPAVIARYIDIAPTTVYAWKKGVGTDTGRVDPQTARAVAYAFGRPVIEAFLSAGLIAREDLNVADEPPLTPAELPDESLLHEIQDRFKRLKSENELLRAERPSPEPEQAPAPAPAPAKQRRGRKPNATSTRRVARLPESRA